MSEVKQDKTKQGSVQTTGHAWDGDIQEFNNPLPRWWLWGFYATTLFAVLYWVFYPAWPVGDSYTKGVFNNITYKVGGKEVTTHWNTRALLMKDLQEGEEAVKQRKYMSGLMAASYEKIVSDPKMMQFTRSVGKILFEDNCAACHGMGGAGVAGLFPNLVDDDWLWGGSLKTIQATIESGRRGYMPGFKKTFNDAQMNDVVEYVMSLSGKQVDEDMAKRGGVLFNGQGGGCYYCHTSKGTGMASVGSANLTDSIWTVAKVSSQKTPETKRKVIRDVISSGISREMPMWKARLSEAEIKVLTVYVHELGGGK
ncbi:MAG: cytochrome-c oxidase, cbb3-type subunit III [Gammaproteobacteria bacterium]|nr:cytochrome-c oxidase, cbb3-type subunit III [Gammaproteobacteria bacterium]